MNTVARKTLSIMMVIGIVVGGLPLFFAATDNAEAAVGVWEKRDSAMSIMHSNGKLTVDVSTFDDEGGQPIAGYTMLLKWDQCRKDLNPLSGFWRTIRDPRTATITTDAKGHAEYKFSLPNGVWTENLWVYGSSEGWQNIEYFLGNIASTNIHLDIQTQASMATQHAMQRADTLGIINGWYELTQCEVMTTAANIYATVSSAYAGAAMMEVHFADFEKANVYLSSSPTNDVGIMEAYEKTNVKQLRSQSAAGTFKLINVQDTFGPDATIEGAYSDMLRLMSGSSAANPTIVKIANANVYGPMMAFSHGAETNDIHYQMWINGQQVLPASGGWQNTTTAGVYAIDLPYIPGLIQPSKMDIEWKFYGTGTSTFRCDLYAPQRAKFVLTGLDITDKGVNINLGSGVLSSIDLDLSGRWGEWQIGGMSSTLTDQDLVPVNAKISSIYPLVISNPRFDQTPIAGAGNGLKFDVYNIKEQATNETIYLSLIADDTTVWSTTVGQREYPAWTNGSKYTTVHLTDISFPAEARREYNLRITSGGAITEIPVVFYPSEMDPDVIYEPRGDLDDIIKDYGTVNAAALRAYHDWAAAMQPRIEVIKADVENYTKLFEDRTATDNLALADAAATRGLELITALKEICKTDGSATSIGELTSHAQGIWSSYQAALLYREAAISFEAGQDAFGNSTALDAWYQDLVSKRIKTGLTDQKQGDDPNSVAVWVGVAVALVVGGLVMYLAWKYIIPPLKRVLPKGRSPRLRTIRAVTPVIVTIVLAVLIALVAFLATWNIALSIEAALR